MKNKYSIGSIVTFKTHPLLYDIQIKGDGKFVPPFMIVKEVFFEDKKKQIVDDITGKPIAERLKYTCVYFDDNKSEFKEATLYETMLDSYENLFIGRKEEVKVKDNYESLISEAKKYKNPTYVYGNIVYFKTKKFEIFKKRSSKSYEEEIIDEKKVNKLRNITQYVVNYTTPEFVLCGYKKESPVGLFYPNGDTKMLVSEILFKVKWFNPFQMKFSDQYLPQECFIDEQPFKTLVKHNK